MSYSNGFVASIIHNNKPIRELSDGGRRTVRLPFGSEYAIRLKNKSKGRAYASVSIDGTDVLGRGEILLRPGQTVDLERFVEDLNGGAKLKFVEAMNSAVQDPTSPDNGGVKITFRPELISMFTSTSGSLYGTRGGSGGCSYSGGILRSASVSKDFKMGSAGMSGKDVINNFTGAAFNCSVSPSGSVVEGYKPPQELSLADAGATVEGSHSTQEFQHTSEWFQTTTPITLEIWLKGPKVAQVEAVMPFVHASAVGTAHVRFGAGAAPVVTVDGKSLGDVSVAILNGTLSVIGPCFRLDFASGQWSAESV